MQQRHNLSWIEVFKIFLCRRIDFCLKQNFLRVLFCLGKLQSEFCDHFMQNSVEGKATRFSNGAVWSELWTDKGVRMCVCVFWGSTSDTLFSLTSFGCCFRNQDFHFLVQNLAGWKWSRFELWTTDNQAEIPFHDLILCFVNQSFKKI